MEICTASNEKDLLHSRLATGLLWIAPWALIIISAIQINNYGGNLVHTLGWTVSFAVMGVACLVNARRCGRLHCYYTAPLFFLAALASLLYGLAILPRSWNGWNWIAGVAIVGNVFAYFGLESLLGKYAKRRSSTVSRAE